MERDGLYIRMGKDGKIARTLVSHGEKKKFKNTTVEDELILFSELNFDCYVEFLHGFGEIGNELLKHLEHETEVNMDAYTLFYNMAYNLCDALDMIHSLHVIWDNYIIFRGRCNESMEGKGSNPHLYS